MERAFILPSPSTKVLQSQRCSSLVDTSSGRRRSLRLIEKKKRRREHRRKEDPSVVNNVVTTENDSGHRRFRHRRGGGGDDDNVNDRNNNVLWLWEVPPEVLFHIVSFVAEPTLRARVLIHQLALLCKTAAQAILQTNDHAACSDVGGGEFEQTVWSVLLKEDYGAAAPYRSTPSSSLLNDSSQRRRFCKRLCRGPRQKVKEAHVRLLYHTEIAYLHVSEVCQRENIAVSKLVRILNDYCPRIHMHVASGGLFLVEVCRARNVHVCVLLKCVRVLVEQYGACVNQVTRESSSNGSCHLSALAVAAVRGMPSIVSYLLSAGADRTLPSSGRFHLHTIPNKCVRFVDETPLELCTHMKAAEKEAGASDRSLADLSKCIKLLAT